MVRLNPVVFVEHNVIPKRNATFRPPKFATMLILGTREGTHYEKRTVNQYRSKCIVLHRSIDLSFSLHGTSVDGRHAAPVGMFVYETCPVQVQAVNPSKNGAIEVSIHAI